MLTLAARWALILVVWAGLFLWIDRLHHPPVPHTALGAEFLPSLEPAPPSASRAGVPVTLPHEWSLADVVHLPYGWYRLRFTYMPSGSPWAIYIESASMNAAVLVNGTPVGSGGGIVEPVSRNLFRPLLLEIPSHLLQPGLNEAVIVVRGVAPRPAFLGRVSIGPVLELSPYFAVRQFLKVDFLYLLAVFSVTTGILTAVMWFYRRQESAYLWHAMAAWSFSAYTLGFALPDLPLAPIARDLLSQGFLVLFIGSVALLIHRTQGLRPVRLERFVAAGLGAGFGIMILLGAFAPEVFYVAAPIWDAAALTMGLWPGWVMLKAYWRLQGGPAVTFMLTGHLLLVFGTHDLLVVSRLIPSADGYYLFYIAALPMLAFTGIMLQRFRASLAETEALNRELSARVAQKSAELEKIYAERRQLEQTQVIAEERERILRDMHDGLGGRLVSTLARLEGTGQATTPAAESVRESLADLRLIIFSLEPSAQNLRTALALMRDRLGRACSDAGLVVGWDLHELPDECVLGPRDTLQVMRVVQEAVTNVLKHAQASRLEVRAARSVRDGSAGVAISVSDDGRGLPSEPAPPGNGVPSMQRRAARLLGALDIECLQPGTCVRLWIPMPAAQAA